MHAIDPPVGRLQGRHKLLLFVHSFGRRWRFGRVPYSSFRRGKFLIPGGLPSTSPKMPLRKESSKASNQLRKESLRRDDNGLAVGKTVALDVWQVQRYLQSVRCPRLALK